MSPLDARTAALLEDIRPLSRAIAASDLTVSSLLKALEATLGA